MPKLKVRVYHSYYGCETGCCGHVVEVNEIGLNEFNFVHPYGEDKAVFARELAEDMIRQFHPACLDSIDWDSLSVDEIRDER